MVQGDDVSVPRSNAAASRGDGEGPLLGDGHVAADPEQGPVLDACAPPTLRRQLTLLDGISFVVGCIVGSGIFVSPGVILQDVGSAGLSVVAWVAGGAIAMIFCLVYADLATSMPSAGGDIEFIRVAYGDATAAALVWSLFFVLRPAGACIQSVAFGHYFAAPLLGIDVRSKSLNDDPRVKAIAVAVNVLLTAVNCFGVQLGADLQKGAMWCKAVLLALLLYAAAAYLAADLSVVSANLARPFEGSTWGGMGPALIASLFAFEGWGKAVYLGEELQNPQRDLPRSAIIGLLISGGIYVTVNLAYYCVLPIEAVKYSDIVAIEAARAGAGRAAGAAVALFVAISIAGNMNGNIFAGGRYIFAYARHGLFPKFMAAVSSRTGSPYAALISQCVWNLVLLILPGVNIASLFRYYGAASWLFYGLTAYAAIKIRRDHPELPRPFPAPLDPLGPAIIIAISAYLVISNVLASLVPSLTGILFVACCFPVYWILYVWNGSFSSRRHVSEAEQPLH